MSASLTTTVSTTVCDLDGHVEERLRARAAQNGSLMEAELRAIIVEAVDAPTRPLDINLYDRSRARVEPLEVVELDLPPRQLTRDPLAFW